MYRATIRPEKAKGKGWEGCYRGKVETKVHRSKEKMPMDSAGLQYKARTV